MTEIEVVPASPDQAGRHPGLGFRGLYEVFVNPTGLFSKIKEDAKILVPYVALGLAAIGLMFILADHIVQAQMQTEAFQRSMEQRGVTGAAANEQVKAVLRISTIGFGTLSMLVIPLLMAGLATFWGNFVFAGKSTFRKILSVTLFGEFLYVLGSYVIVPLVLAKNTMAVSLSLAALLPNPRIDSALYVALSKISVFHIWELIVLGVGYAIVLEFPRNKGLWVAVLSMGLLSVLHVLLTAIGSVFA